MSTTLLTLLLRRPVEIATNTIADLRLYNKLLADNLDAVIVAVNAATSAETAIVAHAGGGQVDAVELSRYFNVLSIVGTAGDSGILKGTRIGQVIRVKNDGANSSNIFPPFGNTLDASAVNVAYALAAGAHREFTRKSATAWISRA